MIKQNFKSNLAITLLGFILVAVATPVQGRDVITKPLFMQTKRVNIEFPLRNDGTNEPQILTEEVEYKYSDNRSEEMSKIRENEKGVQENIDGIAVAHLKDVQVIGKQKSNFSPERDGRVTVDFVIRVPRELLSDDWKLKLSPNLLHNDSIIPLEEVVLKGVYFSDRQKADYAEFEKYVESIVDPEDYDRIFMDSASIDKSIEKRQAMYLEMYEQRWNKVMQYQQKKAQLEERYAQANIKAETRRVKKYYDDLRKSVEKTHRMAAKGADTTGMYVANKRKLDKRNEKMKEKAIRREVSTKSLPKKYSILFNDQIQAEDIGNYVMTTGDSLAIAQRSYNFEAIAQNEIKKQLMEEEKKRMIVFPYDEKTRLDSVVVADRDFLFYYKQDYPVMPGLNSLKITLTGNVLATDRSGYTLPKSDTLNYIISSLAQLADAGMATKETKLYRNMYDKFTIYPNWEANRSDFNIGLGDNKEQIDEFLAKYELFSNTEGLVVDSIKFISASSLDGTFENNAVLSEKRGDAVREYLVNNQSQIPSYKYQSEFIGEDWVTLVSLIRQNKKIENTDAIMDILSKAVYPDETETSIKAQFKSDYKIIQDSIYPKLRRIDVMMYISRPALESADTVIREFREDYSEGVRLLKNREYWEALEILSQYPDYNAALALTCMGYNGRAYDLLVKLPPSANTEYLLAIVTRRMLQSSEISTQHLLNSWKLSVVKAHRSKLDPDIIALIDEFQLTPVLNRVIAGDTTAELFNLSSAARIGASSPSVTTPEPHYDNDIIADNSQQDETVDHTEQPTTGESTQGETEETTPKSENTPSEPAVVQEGYVFEE